MEYTTITILAFLITTWSVSKVQFGSALFFLFDRLSSIIDLSTIFLELLDMTFGLEKLAYALSVVKPLAGPDFRFTIPTAPPSEVDLFVSIAYLVNLGCMCYLSCDDDIRFTKVSPRVLDDFFGSPVLPTWQPNYLFYGLSPVNLEDFLRESPPAKSTNPLDGIFEYPVISTPVRKLAPVVSVPPSSTWSVSAYAGLSSLSARLLTHTTRLFSAILSCAAASKTRYLSAISRFTSKTATLSSLPSLSSCCSLSNVSAADLDLTLIDDADESHDLETEEPRRIFGMVIPADRWQPKVITLADLEIDDGSYLRDALGMSHSESLECGFWPELDEYVPRRSDGRPGRWYTDADEMRGWIFPGREDIPEFVFERIAESDWDVGDVEAVASWADAILQ
ncbi:hypothetical protein L227DRAFT_581271 [Lentinus tigrinus ALCF2SS1-6]|uniref:Uncharacterized protein n=1 Tax=Lentinus tigrinus ALCF2SS1-6 TaxID=1328759 RepID=A0A5C2RPG3_9APHY|nr:hypothetical protein L227DRAFT_581271 [Lentinus tigrinus ALCF2SS1-6]